MSENDPVRQSLQRACGVTAQDMGLGGRNAEEHHLARQSLCARCRWGTIQQRREQLAVTTMCGWFNKPVPSDLVECSTYLPRNRQTLVEMIDRALEAGTVIDVRRGISEKAYR